MTSQSHLVSNLKLGEVLGHVFVKSFNSLEFSDLISSFVLLEIDS